MTYIYIIIILIILLLSFSVRIVTSKNTYLVERFGKYNRKLKPGVNIVIPGVERIVYSYNHDQKLHYCRNNFEINVEFDVDSVENSYYQFGDLNQFIHSLINSYIDRIDVSKNKESKEEIQKLINDTLEDTGISIRHLELVQENK